MDAWPLWNLVLRTPRLELCPDDDAGLLELFAEAERGIHPPDYMPFGVPWTDQHPITWMQHYWRRRADCVPTDWKVHFLVRLDGVVIGAQALYGADFAIKRLVTTGSWIGLRYQGLGYGTEMRSAVLSFAFDHLGATTARSTAFLDNRRSLGVGRRLGYRPDGTGEAVRRGRTAVEQRLLLKKTEFRPACPIRVEGLDRCLAVFGLPAE
ncbi:N-acetyltransferase [Pseudonocardiaceae bacterium YIM PH 21723]|nr:N-acetyltransferase [Pseudonocardiaceae bacterium YIM PH 21723]